MLSIILFAATGCLGPAKVNKWVENHYGENVAAGPKMKADYLTISSPLVITEQKVSNTTKETKKFLPLIFYWQFDYINTCTLNPKIALNTFSATVQSYANSKGLKTKLNGRKLNLSLEQVPNVFALYDRGHIVWFIYAYAWDNISYRPENKEMVVSYTLSKDDTEIKKATVSVPNADKILEMKYLRSINSSTGEYLDQYDESIKAMSKKLVDKIIAEL